MKAYIIKKTYTERIHSGKSHLLFKDGYVADDCAIFWADRCYKTLKGARIACTKLFENNELNRRIERQDEAFRVSQGKAPKEWYIYESETFEPYEVEAIED